MNHRAAQHKILAAARAIVSCRDCPRLVEWREEVARTKRRMFATEEYWGRPVPGFGDPAARLVIVGLAPAAHGANRTGRAFTGDRSGDFLYDALFRAGLASQASSTRRGDGLTLKDVFITLAARCAPPENRPTPRELAACARHLDAELAALRPKVIVALGAIALEATLRSLGRPPAKFEHALELRGSPPILTSYHVSQQNTQTGRLTKAMFDAVIARAKAIAYSA
jgi:uracil-DNA glycosylase family 4